MEENSDLSFTYRGRKIPVKHESNLTSDEAKRAIESKPFTNWYQRCEQSLTDKVAEESSGGKNKRKYIDLRSVEIQSVDMFGARGVGFLKIKADATLVSEDDNKEICHLPGICFLRGNAVTLLVALYCQEDNSNEKVYSLLVEQPRVPVGKASCLELPAGMLDDDTLTVTGTVVKEMEEECGIQVSPEELIDLTHLAFVGDGNIKKHNDMPGLAPSPGGCDEHIRIFYLEKKVTSKQLDEMRGRLAGLREHGEHITLHVVPMADLWRHSKDLKVMSALFLLEQLRQEGKISKSGEHATPLSTEPRLKMSNGMTIPQLSYGMYKIPNNEEGEEAVLNAIKAGYTHFDGAAHYGNEEILGNALTKTGLPRHHFFITTKVWNDEIKEGKEAVRASVEASLNRLKCGGYIDLVLVHWPVHGHYCDAYKELEELYKEGKIRAIGLSNFDIEEYETLLSSGISVQPVYNQLEVSPVMYRQKLVKYFQDKNIVVGGFKSLNRAACFDNKVIVDMAKKYSVEPSQIMLRWSFQKRLIVISKSSNPSRMKQNRDIMHFTLSEDDVSVLDSLTSEEDIQKRAETESSYKETL